MRRTGLFRASLIAGLALLGCGQADPGAAARIDLAETAFDAGRLRQGVRIEHVFVLRNTGGHDLRITRLRPSCDCSATIDTDAAIAPGSTAEITAACDTSGSFGHIVRTVSVFTNDPVTTAVRLELSAEVDFDVAANPRQLYVGRVRAGDEVRTQGRIVFGGGAQITAIESSGLVSARLVETAGAGPHPERRFQVRISDQAPPGSFTNEITIRTTSPTTPVLTVPVVGIVEGTA
jgi:hypothetical protein